MSEKITEKARKALVSSKDVSKAIREYYAWVKEGKAAGIVIHHSLIRSYI